MMVVERGQQENELSDGHRILDSYLGLRFFVGCLVRECECMCVLLEVPVCGMQAFVSGHGHRGERKLLNILL